MKYCEKCGSQLDDMSVFCDDCGTEQSSSEVQYSTQTVNTQTAEPLLSEPKQQKNGKGVLITILVLMVCLIVVGVVGFTKGWFNFADKTPITEDPIAETAEVEETKVDSNDLLHTLVWKDDKEKVEEFKKETISGYDKTIGEAFSSPAEGEEATAYNIINWSYAEYNDNTYLSLNYNYDNSNYNVVFYKDIHANINIAELYIDNNKYDKESFTTWSDKVFVEVTPEVTNQDIGIIEEFLGMNFYSTSSGIGIRFVSSTEVAILNNDDTIARSMTYDVYDVKDSYVSFTLDGYNYFICYYDTGFEIKDDAGNGKNTDYPYSGKYIPTLEPTEEPKQEPVSNVTDADVELARTYLCERSGQWTSSGADSHKYPTIRFEMDGTMEVYGYYDKPDAVDYTDNSLFQTYSLTKGKDGVIINIGQNGQYYINFFSAGEDTTMRLDSIKGGVYTGWWISAMFG